MSYLDKFDKIIDRAVKDYAKKQKQMKNNENAKTEELVKDHTDSVQSNQQEK